MQKLTEEQALVLSAYTGVCMCDFSALHAYIEKSLGRPVWTHELANKDVWAEIREAVKPAFLKLCPTPETKL